MTLWRALETLAIAAAALIGGTAAAAGLLYLLAKIARRYGSDDTPMGTTITTHPVKDKTEAETIRARAAARHDRADEHHAEGRQIESGEPDRRFSIKLTGRR